MENQQPPNDRLGLALAGGGFRAALFHLGVLQHLADIDLLRYVQVISTVSGGSIVGALYVLMLKKALEAEQRRNTLTQQDYQNIVSQVRQRLYAGIDANLRTRLILYPHKVMAVAFSKKGLGQAMAELYGRYFFDGDAGSPKGILLKDIIIQPGRQPITAYGFEDIDSYNKHQAQSRGSVITKLIINATSLNTGSRFWFSATELGEWHYGHMHYDNIEAVLARKRYLRLGDKIDTDLGDARINIMDWLFYRQPLQSPWQALMRHAAEWQIELDALAKVEMGLLRLARLPAWRLLRWPQHHGVKIATFGGLNTSEHALRLGKVLGVITHNYVDKILQWCDALKQHQNLRQQLLQFINEIYLWRSAANFSASIAEDWNSWTLADAVAASANFPPVFPPYKVFNIYDNNLVSRLGLTDGGVYDNLGVSGLFNENCNYIISSDTGIPIEQQDMISRGRLAMLWRVSTILSDADSRQTRSRMLESHQLSAGIGRLQQHCLWDSLGQVSDAVTLPDDQRDQLDQQWRQSLSEFNTKIKEVHSLRELHGLAAFQIASKDIAEHDPDPEAADGQRAYTARQLARIRTDLDVFGDMEKRVLERHGRNVAGRFLHKWFGFQGMTDASVPRHMLCRYGENLIHYPFKNTADPVIDTPQAVPSGRLVKAIFRAAPFRFGRIFLLFPYTPWSWLAWALLLGALTGFITFTWGRSLDIPWHVFGLDEEWRAWRWPINGVGQWAVVILSLLFLIGIWQWGKAAAVAWIEKNRRSNHFTRAEIGGKLLALPRTYLLHWILALFIIAALYLGLWRTALAGTVLVLVFILLLVPAAAWISHFFAWMYVRASRVKDRD